MTLKFRCDRNNLLNAVSNANRAVAKHGPSLAALTGLHLGLDDDNLVLTGSDLDITIAVTTDVAGHESGEAVIPAKLLLDVIRVMPAGSLELVATKEEAVISSGTTEFTIRVLSVHDWPQLPTVENDMSDDDTLLLESGDLDSEVDEASVSDESKDKTPDDAEQTGSYSVTADGNVFRDALHQVVRSASTDDTRPILTGVLMSSEDNGIRLVSTDSYRLSLRDLPGSKLLGKQQQVLVPGRALSELQRMINDSDQITLRLSSKRAEFEVGGMRLTARLIEGDFPNYRSLIPSKSPKHLESSKITVAGSCSSGTPACSRFNPHTPGNEQG